MTFYEILNTINYDKEWVNVEERGFDYTPFAINRVMSYGRDTIMYAQEMNTLPFVTKQMHFDYFINSLRKSKRYNKGFDRDKNELISLVMKYYNYTYPKAKEILDILSDDQITIIKKKVITN